MGQYRMVRYLHRIRRKAPQWSASVPQRSEIHRNAPWSVCLSVGIRHPGETAEWLGTRLGVVVGVGVCIGVLDFDGHRRRGMGSFVRGKFGTFHCNQWDCLRDGWQGGSSQITLGFFLL